MEFIDSHCHLIYDYSPKAATDLIREADAAGVKTLINVGTELSSFAPIQAVSEAFPRVFHTIGVHPHEAATLTDADLATIEAAALHPKCRAIGEIGIDTHYEHSPLDAQIQRLRDQLAIALRVELPIVIHSRESEAELLLELTEYAKQVPSGRVPGVIHCFTGSYAFGQACLDLGFYISFSGILTFKNAEDLRESARKFPLDRLLVETDSPYLAPIPFRGKKCEPAMVRFTAQKLAEIKGCSLEEVAGQTTANARRVFRLCT